MPFLKKSINLKRNVVKEKNVNHAYNESMLYYLLTNIQDKRDLTLKMGPYLFY